MPVCNHMAFTDRSIMPLPGATSHDDITARDAAITALVRPLPDPVYATQVAIKRIPATLAEWAEDYGCVELNPEYQRGRVWTDEQHVRFVEALMRGTVGEQLRTITFNCPQFLVRGALTASAGLRDLPDGVECMDGLQRLTAVERWTRGELRPFGLSLDDVAGTGYDPLRGAMAYRLTFAVHAFQTRAEILDYYLAVNAGGTVHTETEIARVRAMRAALPASGIAGSTTG